jgi:hypothetical protein
LLRAIARDGAHLLEHYLRDFRMNIAQVLRRGRAFDRLVARVGGRRGRLLLFLPDAPLRNGVERIFQEVVAASMPLDLAA